MTHYIQIVFPGEVGRTDPACFTPWKNADRPLEYTARLAAFKALREAGYLLPASPPKAITLRVYAADDNTPRYKSGRFKMVQCFVMEFTKQ